MVGTIIVEPAAEEFNSTYSVETKEETISQKINKIRDNLLSLSHAYYSLCMLH